MIPQHDYAPAKPRAAPRTAEPSDRIGFSPCGFDLTKGFFEVAGDDILGDDVIRLNRPQPQRHVEDNAGKPHSPSRRPKQILVKARTAGNDLTIPCQNVGTDYVLGETAN